MSNRNNRSQAAEEIVDFIDKNPTDTGRKGPGSHDVSHERRVLKGNGDKSGEWTAGIASVASNSVTASGDGPTVTIMHPDGTAEIRTGEKTILSYLLKPVLKAREAFRER